MMVIRALLVLAVVTAGTLTGSASAEARSGVSHETEFSAYAGNDISGSSQGLNGRGDSDNPGGNNGKSNGNAKCNAADEAKENANENAGFDVCDSEDSEDASEENPGPDACDPEDESQEESQEESEDDSQDEPVPPVSESELPVMPDTWLNLISLEARADCEGVWVRGRGSENIAVVVVLTPAVAEGDMVLGPASFQLEIPGDNEFRLVAPHQAGSTWQVLYAESGSPVGSGVFEDCPIAAAPDTPADETEVSSKVITAQTPDHDSLTELPYTGFSTGWAAILAAILMAAGGGLLAHTRRLPDETGVTA